MNCKIQPFISKDVDRFVIFKFIVIVRTVKSKEIVSS